MHHLTGLFDVQIPYAEENMIETSGDLGALKALGLSQVQ